VAKYSLSIVGGSEFQTLDLPEGGIAELRSLLARLGSVHARVVETDHDGAVKAILFVKVEFRTYTAV